MPRRGNKPIMPKSGGATSGMFSSKGKQKADSTASAPSKPLMGYAKSSSGRTGPKSRKSKGA